MALSNSLSTQNRSALPLKASQAFLNRISALVPGTLTAVVQNERRVVTTPANLYPLLTVLKSHTGREFAQLRDITAIDHPERTLRFEVVYSLLSIASAQRLSLSVRVAEGETLPSVVGLYPSAGWYEREIWDRFGIPFSGHSDLRRRLTDYGFVGHPLRKDFPVTGYVEVQYSIAEKRVLTTGVTLAQEYRIFTLESP